MVSCFGESCGFLWLSVSYNRRLWYCCRFDIVENLCKVPSKPHTNYKATNAGWFDLLPQFNYHKICLIVALSFQKFKIPYKNKFPFRILELTEFNKIAYFLKTAFQAFFKLASNRIM